MLLGIYYYRSWSTQAKTVSWLCERTQGFRASLITIDYLVLPSKSKSLSLITIDSLALYNSPIFLKRSKSYVAVMFVRYKQVGNAVAVPVASALGFALGQAFQGLTTGSDPLFILPEDFPKPTFWIVGTSVRRDSPSFFSYCCSSQFI